DGGRDAVDGGGSGCAARDPPDGLDRVRVACAHDVRGAQHLDDVRPAEDGPGEQGRGGAAQDRAQHEPRDARRRGPAGTADLWSPTDDEHPGHGSRTAPHLVAARGTAVGRGAQVDVVVRHDGHRGRARGPERRDRLADLDGVGPGPPEHERGGSLSGPVGRAAAHDAAPGVSAAMRGSSCRARESGAANSRAARAAVPSSAATASAAAPNATATSAGSRLSAGNHRGWPASTVLAALPGSWTETIGLPVATYSKTLPLVT